MHGVISLLLQTKIFQENAKNFFLVIITPYNFSARPIT